MKSTDKIELAETHALTLSLQRIRAAAMSRNCWKRALYHALLMAGCEEDGFPRGEMMKAIREALRLP